MNDTSGIITEPFIRNTMKTTNTSVLSLVMFYETRHKNAMKAFRVFSCVIHTIIDNHVCVDYLAFQSKQLSDICIDRKYLEKMF